MDALIDAADVLSGRWEIHHATSPRVGWIVRTPLGTEAHFTVRAQADGYFLAFTGRYPRLRAEESVMDPLVLRALRRLGVDPALPLDARAWAVAIAAESVDWTTTYEHHHARLLALALLRGDASEVSVDCARWLVDPEAAMDLAMARVQRETRALDAEAVAPC